MRIDYQLILDETLKNLEGTPNLLIHACCAPCSSYVIEYLSEFFNITIIYYNPNIFPDIEYQRRLNELKEFINSFKVKNSIKFIEDEYIEDEFSKAISGLEELGERSKRCYNCYQFRMERIAKYAADYNYDFFTTTLSISPYKNSDWINEIGVTLEDKYKIKYLYADFKKRNGYKRSIELSKEYGLYRQDYCGCIYSQKEKTE